VAASRAAAAVGHAAGEQDVVHARGEEGLDEAVGRDVGGRVAAEVQVGDVGQRSGQSRLRASLPGMMTLPGVAP
jgi:hypothetical protein